MEEAEVRVGGAVGGLAAVFRATGRLVFAMLTGREYSRKIDRGVNLVIGGIVLSAVVGAVIGSYHLPYPRDPLGFWASPLNYFRWHGHTGSGALSGAFVGLGLGLFLLFITQDPDAKAIKDEIFEETPRTERVATIPPTPDSTASRGSWSEGRSLTHRP